MPDRIFAFDQDTAVTANGPGRWLGQVSDRWDIGIVPNGGYVLAVALAALRSAIGRPHPLTVTAHYLSPCTGGPVDIEVDVVKQGRTLSSGTARLVQDERVRLLVVASFGDLQVQSGPTMLTSAPPDIPDPQDCLTDMTDRPSAFPVAPTITRQIEFRPSPCTAENLLGARRGPAHIEGWMRFTDGREPDVDCLPLFCDALPPAIFAAMHTGWVPTLELTVHVRAVPAPGWIAAVAMSRAVIDGTLEEDCQLWDSSGRLVAMSRQLARVLPPAA